ncbi:MAG: hypothetical protein GY851_03435 [bacterium]|nr:hypothetical protein [bacterium]
MSWIPTGHIHKFGGDIWYVSKSGNDSNSGKDPINAFLTIGAAITAAAAGDAISVKAGAYDENGLDLNDAGLELWCEIGVTLSNTNPGTVLTVSGASCRVRGCKIEQAGQIGLAVTGTACAIEDVLVDGCTVSYDLNGSYARLVRCQSQEASVTGYDIANKECLLYLCNAVGEGSATRGFYLSNAAADRCMLYQCVSAANATAGFHIIAGCTYNVLVFCNSASSDGAPIDVGTSTYFGLDFVDSLEQHENVYPFPDGEGTAGTPISIQSEVNDETGADSTADYFGDCAVIMPPATRTAQWFWEGVNLFATTSADDQRYTGYRIVYGFSASRNGGNNWDENVTVLTVTDATEAAQFEVNDLVWITTPGYKPHGEIVKVTDVTAAVITIARQTENSARLGLHWNHTTNDGGNEVMYLCYRNSAQYHAQHWDFTAANAKDFAAHRFVSPRRMAANDGIVVRMINGTDAANSEAALATIYG